MAIASYYDGPAAVSMAAAVSALEAVGYTANGVTWQINPFYNPLPCDLYGGERGPEIDTQALGEQAIIRLDLTRFEISAYEKFKKIVNGGTVGTFTAFGTLMIQEGAYWRILINTPARPVNFPICTVESIEENKATVYKRPFVTFKAHPNPLTGKVYDDTIT